MAHAGPLCCRIAVTVNVIFDSSANRGRGFTKEQKAAFERTQLEAARERYATENIDLKVSYSEGTLDSTFESPAGEKRDAVNVFVSQWFPIMNPGLSGRDRKTGAAYSYINVNMASDASSS